jgi:hypothetical protein
MIEEDCSRIPFAVFQIFIFSLICLVITFVVIMYHMRNKWSNNWEKYRCNFEVMPFASIINPETTVMKNFNECMQMKTEPILKAYTEKKLNDSIAENIKENEKVQQSAQDTMNQVEESEKELNSRFSFLLNIYEHILNIMVYISHKIQNFFYKIGAIVWTLYYFMIAQINAVMIMIARLQRAMVILNALLILITALSLFWTPLLPLTVIMAAIIVDINITQELARKRAYCCFTPETLINMKDGNKKEIQNVELGDLLDGDGEVLGFVKVVLEDDMEVIKLNPNTYVTPDHIMLTSENCWEYVGNTNLGEKTTSNTVGCLVTSNNIIKSGNMIFKDYEEVSNIKCQCEISKIMVNSLNKDDTKFTPNPEYELGEINNCVPKGTLIKMKDGSFKPIEEIEFGEQIKGGGKVYGIYKCCTRNIEWFEINGTIISPRIIFSLYNEPWAKVYNEGEKNDYKCDFGYHLVTMNQVIELENNVIIRDFVENNTEKVQDKITKIIENYIKN